MVGYTTCLQDARYDIIVAHQRADMVHRQFRVLMAKFQDALEALVHNVSLCWVTLRKEEIMKTVKSNV